MPLEPTPLMWHVQPLHWSDLSEPQKSRYIAIVASYGGSDRAQRGFRRYRVAEVCARSIGTELGIATMIDLTT